MNRKTLYTFLGTHSSPLSLGGSGEWSHCGSESGDERTEGSGTLWSDRFQPRENKKAAREKYTRPRVEPGLHSGEVTQRKSPTLGLSAARRGRSCSCYSNMVSTWAKLHSHLFNTQTPHSAPRCHKAKGSYKYVMWGRVYRAGCCFFSPAFSSSCSSKCVQVAPDRRVMGHGFSCHGFLSCDAILASTIQVYSL